MKKLKLYLLSFLLFGVLSGILVGCTELLLRWSSVQSSEERRDHVIETPYLPVRFRPDYQGQFWGVTFETNRYGFRDEPDFPLKPGENEFRILSLGDSIGFGLGIKAEDHYTQIAEKRLRRLVEPEELHLVNAGGQGYSPSGYLVYIKNEALRLEPDMVVVETELCNDVTDEALLQWGALDGKSYPDRIFGGRYLVAWDGNLLGTYSTGSYFFEKTYLYTVGVRRSFNLMNRLQTLDPFDTIPGARVYYSLGFDEFVLDRERIEEGWKRLFLALKGTQELLRDRNVPLLVMIMPSRYLYQDAGDYTRYAERIYDRGIELAEQYGLNYVPLAEPVRRAGGASLFFDFAHLTAEGNQVVGDYLAVRLQETLRPSREAHDDGQ